MKDYSGVHIAAHTWAPLEHLADGRSRRVWHIKLERDAVLSKPLEELTSILTRDIVASIDPTLENDLSIDLEMPNPREIVAHFTTQRDASFFELLVATWHMFEGIDHKIGTIESIEEQPRAVWPPWNLQRGTKAKITADLAT